MSTDSPSPTPTRNDPTWRTVAARAAIPAGYGLIVGVLAALGIQGDLLARLIRNSPLAVAWAFTFAVAAVVLPILGTAFIGRGHARWIIAGFDAAGAVLLVVAIGTVVFPAAGSYSQREQPIITIQNVVVQEDGSTSATLVTSALSLQTQDRMILRVIAFGKDASAVAADAACPDARKHVPSVPGSILLFWGETGPTSAGTASNQITVAVNRAEYPYLCALTGLTDRTKPKTSDDQRFSWLLIDLRHVPAK